MPLLALLVSVHGQVLQTNLATPWIKDVTVGVRGGLPVRTNLIDASAAPYNANKTGTADATAAIQAAIAATPSNSVTYLPNGTYIIDGVISLNKNGVTLRGESRDGVRLVKTNAVNGILGMGGQAAAYGDRIPVLTGFMKGSTNVTLASASGGLAGDVVAITMLNPVHDALRVISVAGHERLIDQRVVITALSNGTNVTFSPPLVFDFTNQPTMFSVGLSSLNPIFGSRHRMGVENLTISQSNRLTGMKGSAINMLSAANAVDCWVTGVKVEWINNYGFNIADVAHFYYASNEVVDSQAATAESNHAGLLAAYTSGGLFENNIFANRFFPAIEYNSGFSGNALFANYFTNNALDVDCHNSHTLMNLWEANHLDNTFLTDGYFGSASHQVLWRNAIQSTFIPVGFKRWTTYMQVIGNVLGRAGSAYTAYAHDIDGQGFQILELGRPNIGNSSFIGTTPSQAWNWPGNTFAYGTLPNGWRITKNQGPTNVLTGNFLGVPAPVASIYSLVIQDGSNTNRYYTGTNGAGGLVSLAAGTSTSLRLNAYVSVKSNDVIYVAGQTAYQQRQSTDKETHVIHGNYDFYNKDIIWDANISSRSIPSSILYPDGPPRWWGTNRWPAIDPAANPRVGLIPSQARYFGIPIGNGDEVPPSVPLNLAAPSISFDRLNLTWSASSDNVGIASYRIDRSQGVGSTAFALVGTSSGPEFTDLNLAGNTVYNYRVAALDAAGNVSGYSLVATATTANPPPDQTSPSIPLSLAALPASASQVNLSWNVATDNIGVAEYRLERSQGVGSTGFSEIGTPTGLFFTDSGLSAATVYNYRVRAADAVGNLSDYSVMVTVTTGNPADQISPSVPGNISAITVGTSRVDVGWSASTDNSEVVGYRLERSEGAGSSSFVQVATPSGTTVSDSGLSAGTVFNYRVRAADAAGNLSDYSTVVTATTSTSGTTPPNGLVAAYGFNEPFGSTAMDASGNGNAGAITGAARTALGKFGRALAFNGVDNLVLVNSSSSLNSTSAMTLEAWVYPSAARSTWSAVLHRDPDTYYLHVSSPDGPMLPAGGGVFGSSEQYVSGPAAVPLNQWTHLASTYDGTILRLYVNGVEVSSRAMAGLIQSTASPLRIGGNSYPNQFFDGLIDEVRIYRRALTTSEIAADMNTPVVNTSAKPPTPGSPRIIVQSQ